MQIMMIYVFSVLLISVVAVDKCLHFITLILFLLKKFNTVHSF